MSWIIWAVLGALVGPIALIGLPVMIGLVGSDQGRERAGAFFSKHTIHLLGRAALIPRSQGGLELVSVADDPKFDRDRVSYAGEDGHLSDDLGVKSYLNGKPFGIGHEAGVYISPLFAEFGAAARRAAHEGRIGAQPDGGIRLDFEVPRKPQIPDLRKAVGVLDGSADDRDGIVAEDWTKKSQAKFRERVSLGQTILLLIAFGAGVGLAFLTIKYAPDNAGGGVSESVPLTLGALFGVVADETVAEVRERHPLRAYAVVFLGALAGVALAGVAVVTDGALAAMAFLGVAAGTAIIPAVVVVALKDALPANGLWATLAAMLAQITYGESCLIRTRDGEYQWRALRHDSRGFYVVLDDGREVGLDGDVGDLDRWAWGQIAIVEEKAPENMDRWTVDDELDSDGETRASLDVLPPSQEQPASWPVSLKHIQTATRGAAQSDIVRRGREKALEEAGGTQQISELTVMVFAAVLVVLGFVLGWGALTL